MRVTVEVPDDPVCEETVRQLEAMLQAGAYVVLLRQPDLPEAVWRAVSPTLVARAHAALHGAPVEPMLDSALPASVT
jgi:hypothetical protein